MDIVSKPKPAICHPGWYRMGHCWQCEPYVKPKIKAMIKTVIVDGVRQAMLYFCCPGCAEIFDDDGLIILPINSDGEWKFKGTLQHPSTTPSIDTKTEDGQRCHLYLTNGVFIYERDSTHSMRGKDVPLPDLPDWVVEMLEKKGD